MSEEKKTHPEHKYSVTFVSKVGTKRNIKNEAVAKTETEEKARAKRQGYNDFSRNCMPTVKMVNENGYRSFRTNRISDLKVNYAVVIRKFSEK